MGIASLPACKCVCACAGVSLSSVTGRGGGASLCLMVGPLLRWMTNQLQVKSERAGKSECAVLDMCGLRICRPGPGTKRGRGIGETRCWRVLGLLVGPGWSSKGAHG